MDLFVYVPTDALSLNTSIFFCRVSAAHSMSRPTKVALESGIYSRSGAKFLMFKMYGQELMGKYAK
jgi:hypothetical protein